VLPLSEAIQFSAPEVVFRFQQESGFSVADSEQIFLETKKWLWICAKREAARALEPELPPLLISPELDVIDRMWHTFLLFTHEYQNFCNQCLGRFVHHVPLTRAERERAAALRAENPETALQQRQFEIRPQLVFLCAELGEDTVRRWYQEFPKKFRACTIEPRPTTASPSPGTAGSPLATA
jgi:hypothetical protein